MSVHQDWLAKLDGFRALLGEAGIKAQLPPPSLAELGLEYLEIEEGKRMLAKLPFQQRFTNPAGIFQGGFLAAGLDEVFGPLSYVTSGRICLTLAMNISYLKPFHPGLSHVLIEATVLKKTRSFIFMRAEVRSPEGELLAHAENHVHIQEK
jgi:uncharacterized protein (TIGR00369 family)